MMSFNQSQGHLFPDVMVVGIKVFGPLMKSRVGAQINRRQVVKEKQGSVWLRYTKITK